MGFPRGVCLPPSQWLRRPVHGPSPRSPDERWPCKLLGPVIHKVERSNNNNKKSWVRGSGGELSGTDPGCSCPSVLLHRAPAGSIRAILLSFLPHQLLLQKLSVLLQFNSFQAHQSKLGVRLPWPNTHSCIPLTQRISLFRVQHLGALRCTRRNDACFLFIMGRVKFASRVAILVPISMLLPNNLTHLRRQK